ncbi:YedE-related selenium metabolism membrane protein [Shewanella sp. WXL01]|uniref:YedE-related selenium metabolism membrane protein n=1 Tax=Shewanella maritima TaxID=2520507 RepID=A0A411PGD7_9GAMM|nr:MULTISPECIES: YedE family putative selenium transporter [Shewanella]NKF49244.1 YedE-related selenium metabolism membrane protein [Shewanella sp. WXL01]QBF82647.1 YedE-related selenium metabolism membrane protein [Shewanella maritima]
MGFFASKKGIVLVGAVIGLIAAFLQFMGNPPNMGVCVACFERDIAGALGFHRAAVVQYLRPEIMGFVLGSMVAALMAKEFSPRGGSAPTIRFFLGMFAMIGALVFLGCPWRTLLRLAGGDGNAIFGFLGLVVGTMIGGQFIKNGFSLGRAHKGHKASGWVFPAFMFALLLLAIFTPKFGANAIFESVKGPGAMHAPMWLSIGAGLLIGGLAQRSRFCTMGAIRDVFVARDFHLISGVVSLLIFAFIANFALGQFNPGFDGQPIAHTNSLWNFLGMILAGAAFVMAGGCPGRQLILAGEGDSDAAVFVMGMIMGAGVAHNFMLASSPKGITPYAPYAVVIGLVFVLAIGFAMRTKFKFD